MQITQDHRLSGHEMVMEAQNQAHHLLWEKKEAETQVHQSTVHATQQQKALHDQRLEGTMQQVDRLTQEYQRAQLAWQQRQTAHEEETKRTQHQMEKFQRAQMVQPPIARLAQQVPYSGDRPLPPPTHPMNNDPMRWTAPTPSMTGQG